VLPQLLLPFCSLPAPFDPSTNDSTLWHPQTDRQVRMSAGRQMQKDVYEAVRMGEEVSELVRSLHRTPVNGEEEERLQQGGGGRETAREALLFS